MDYEYRVLSANSYGEMQQELNICGMVGWKLVNVVWDNDNACLVAVMMQERQMISFLIYTFTSFKKIRE